MTKVKLGNKNILAALANEHNFAEIKLNNIVPSKTILAGTSNNALILKSIDLGQSFSSQGSAGKGNPICFCQLSNGNIIYGTDIGYIVNNNTSEFILIDNGNVSITALSLINNNLYFGDVNGNYGSAPETQWMNLGIDSNLGNTKISVINKAGFFTDSGYYNFSESLIQVGNFTCAADAANGFIYTGTNDGHIWRNTNVNDYETWTDLGVIGENAQISDLLYTNGRFIIGRNNGTVICISDDNFNSYSNVFAIDNSELLFCLVESNIVIAGDNVANIYRSTDNGSNWDPISGNPQQGESSINCLISY